MRVAPDGSVTPTGELDARSLAGEVVMTQERRRRLERSRVEMLRGYAETDGCRRRYLLNYLGEEYDPPCGMCDRCRTQPVEGTAAEASQPGDAPFALNDRVRHATHGAGLVARVEPGRVIVAFDDAGYKTLDLGTSLENGLLRREAS